MASAKPMTGKDILLLLLYSPGVADQLNEPVAGRTRLMKVLFVFKEELYAKFRFDKVVDSDELPTFYPWRFGPFSRDVFDDIEFFSRIGFIQVARGGRGETTVEEAEEYRWWEEMTSLDDETPPEEYAEFNEESFSLTARGVGFVREKGLYDHLSPNQKQILKEYKARFSTASLAAIIQYVYKMYPQMTEKSEIRNRYH